MNKIPTPADGVAWVTGASSGIGREVAVQLAAAGWTVAISARRREELETLAAAYPGKMLVCPLDITDTQAVAEAVAGIEAQGRPIARAVLNAGIYIRDTAPDFDIQKFKAQVDVNLIGTANCLAAVMPLMLGRRGGQIGIVGSVAGLNGLPAAVTYCSTKAGLIAMAESLKFDLDKAGVGISMILPGFVKTPATAGNPYPMPYLMEAGDAVRALLKGLDGGRYLIAFPWQLAWALRFFRILPSWAYFAIMKRQTGW
jgi:short-subunit dehydrogenase